MTAPESPATLLRRAAALMRERAGKATKGPWNHMCLGSEGCLVLRAHGTIRERGRAERPGALALHSLSPGPLAVARAYLGEQS